VVRRIDMVRQAKANAFLCGIGAFLLGTVALIGSLVTCACSIQAEDNIPAIQITLIPPSAKGGPDVTYAIAGVAKGVDFAAYKVVVYAHAGQTWWVQPFANAPFTDIGTDGKWQTDTHGGDRYAALLVKKDYHAQATARTLPATGNDVVAIVRNDGGTDKSWDRQNAGSPATPKSTAAARRIQFSGFEWLVKESSDQRVGPGPNYFSKDGVRVDQRGLHLRVFGQNDRNYCAEVINGQSLGYGTYRFVIGSNIDELDPNLVVGLFTWNDNPAYHHREIDIEISRWGVPANDNAQYVVQPYTRKANIVRFALPQGLEGVVLAFTWRPESVDFRASRLPSSQPATPQALVIFEHRITTDVPRAGGENARINLWLVNGRHPTGGADEVTIQSFEFQPLRD